MRQRSGSVKVSQLINPEYFQTSDIGISLCSKYDYIVYLCTDKMKTGVCVCVHVCVSVMHRLEKWIYGQKIQYIGFTKTYRAN